MKPLIQVAYVFLRREKSRKDEEKIPVLCAYNMDTMAGTAN